MFPDPGVALSVIGLNGTTAILVSAEQPKALQADILYEYPTVVVLLMAPVSLKPAAAGFPIMLHVEDDDAFL